MDKLDPKEWAIQWIAACKISDMEKENELWKLHQQYTKEDPEFQNEVVDWLDSISDRERINKKEEQPIIVLDGE